MQKRDFIQMFKEAGDLPVTIRLLDPPLHEFLPKTEQEKEQLLAENSELTLDRLNEIIASMQEFNPMLGFRGCRIAIKYPEIARMQTRAIIEAGMEAKEKYSIEPNIEIMIPLTTSKKECKFIRDIIENEINEVTKKSLINVNYKIGTMIEVPRACLVADEIAQEMDFFSFGTNDLTQMAYGLSRDDSTKFLKEYVNEGLIERDPFESLDQNGVGVLMETALHKARKVKSNLKAGICGEHGGDPDSVKFCYSLGLNYVSCSPYRVAIAKLAGAQATLN